MKQRGAEVFVAVDFAPRPHHHISRNGEPSETFLGALGALNGSFVAARHNDHEVNVAVFSGRAPSVRTEEINFLRLKLDFQPFKSVVQKVRRNCFHGLKATIMAAALKVRVFASGSPGCE